MNRWTPSRSMLMCLSVVVALVAGYRYVIAVDRTWDGNCPTLICAGVSRTPLWTDGPNWGAGDIAPAPGDKLIFGASSFQFSTINTFAAGTSFDSMLYNGGAYAQSGNAVALTNGIIATGSGSATISLPISLNQNQTFAAETAGSGLMFSSGTISTGGRTLTIGGNGGVFLGSPITGTGGVNVQGTGQYTLAGNHPYTGDTQVTNAALTLACDCSASAFTLGNAVLRGAGTVKSLSSSGSSIEPGAAGNGTGIVSSTAGLQFVVGTLAVDLKGVTPGTQHDQLNVIGAVRLSSQFVPGFPALTVSLPAFTPAAGNTFVIVQNDGVDPVEGTFLSLPEGASFDVPNGSGGNTTFFITYRGGDGNDVVLNVPGTLTWTGAGAGSNSNWSNRANWSPSRLPISGERLVFPATGQSFSINDFPAGFVLRSITITGSHTLNGNAVQLTEGLLNNAPAGAGVNLGIGGSGAVTQSSDGLLVLSAANTFTGLVSVVQGTLRITHAGALGGGSAGTVVAAGATLQLSMPPASLDQIPESIQLTGMGVGGAGALEAIGANNAFWSGPVTLTATAAIGSSQPAAGFSLFGAISGTGGLTKVGNGVVDLAGSAANSYTGPTSINAGTLHLEKLAGTAVTSPLTIGDGVQESGAARSRLLAASANQLPPLGGTVVMNGGAMELTRESIASLSMSAESTIQRFGANAVLTLGGDVAMTGSNLIFVDRLVLGASVTFTTTGQTNQVFAQIDERGSASGLTKTGPGTMTLLVPSTSTTGSTYTGVTTVAAGTLELLDSRSLGAVSGGTVVNAGAALRVIASSAIHFEPLSINGSGIAGTGAVIAADTNTWSGTVTLGGDTVINTSTGTTVFTMSSIGGTGELQKTGPGELRIDGAGSSRPSRLRAGSLVIQFSPHLQPITIEAGTLLGFGTTGAITAEGAGAKAIAPGFSPGRLTAAGNVQLSATTAYLVELNGATAASQHDQLSVTGTVSLQDATLTVVPGFAVPLDQTFVIIANDGADPVIGTFAGLPEGAAPTFLGQRFQISYRGGDGNDVTLRRVSDTLPTIAITDVVVNEGNAGAANALFLVTLSAASSQQVTVQYATADGTATVAGGDYAARSGTLTFAPNETTATIAVPVTGDTTPEPDETFTVTLTSPVNALLGDAQATGRITNDEASTVPPTVSIDDVSIGEGDSVQVVASFTVRLSAPTGVAVSVPYATADGTAVAGQDYTAASGTVTLPAGSTSAPVLVTVLGDLTDELDETFAVNLGTPVNATLADGQAVGTIVNNDSPTAGPSMSIAPVSVAEGNTGTTSAVFAVTLSAPSAQVVSASFATSAETAVAPTDYPAQTGVVTFPPNTTAQTIVVSIVGDRVVEPDETFLVTLSNPVNAKIGDGQARGTIRNDDVRPTITIDGPASITATSPFLTIKGTASDDLGIASVTWTSNRGGGGAAEGTTSWTIRGIPLQKGVNVITVTADDIDGTVAAADLDPESVRLNTASATLTVTVNEFLYFLAEGATGAFFDEDIAIANPNAVAAPVSVTFLKEDGTTVPHTLTVPVTGRATIAVEQIAGLAATAVSAVVSSTDALPLVVERSMFWDQSYYGAHTGSAVDGARTKWLFGEGSQGFFDTFVLLANANPEPASVTVTFLTESGAPVPRVVTVGATSRLNVFTGAIPELVGKSFSIVVDSNRPIIAERAMYFGTPLFNGGHESAGVSEPSTSWFHAEGATGPFFDTFILVGNPNPAPATVTLTYLLDTGQVVTRTKTVAASSRLTVDVESEDPQLRDAAVSTTVTSTLPVISERAMYWPGTFTSWFEAHNSFGLTEVSTKWGLAEGRVGGPRAFETYILLANPNAATANVTVTYLKTDGTTVVKTHPVAPTSRFNVFVNGSVPELQNESFGAVIVSDLPIAVERALYNSSGGVFFAAGTNATAVKLP